MAKRREEFAARREAMGFTQEGFATRLGVELSTVGRWERGTLTPQPWRRSQIAGALGVSLERLEELLTATVTDTGSARHRNAAQLGGLAGRLDGIAVVADARDAERFAREVAAATISQQTLDQISAEIDQFAVNYVFKPLAELFVDIRELRFEVFQLAQNNRSPTQLRQLYLDASRAAGLHSHICLDLGHYHAAHTHALTAFLCADLAGHNGMRAWVRGLQSLISYWDGDLAAAVEFARDGAGYCAHGSVAARLPSLEARACAALGEKDNTLAALDRTDRARATIDKDDDAGVFTFPRAKQAVYTGTALLALGDRASAARAAHESSQALELYEAAAPSDRSSGDILAARLDLGTAYLLQDDLDGLRDQLDTVLDVPPVRRTASIVKRAADIGQRLDRSRYANAAQGQQMRSAITAFCATQPALPTATGMEQA
ncbi:helix-turn-helix domain-containing protein [Saccharopolyspora spinosa]|uniref:Helix-turn-helix protein n=1 Tax=Saccharopolyspora spinosa TaxID=60894 RepID=A0A2N3Y6R5_SACSN|nr:helix-turn-helix transcriptional regulator [Saccharopolyspora spinosa]PKW18642.1 helix-turn-helix protein [Saccharopolyspora spinosa]